jgi:hypothetical protein
MRIEIHHFHHSPDLNIILERIKKMSDALDAKIAELQSDVASLTTVDGSAVALINGFAAQLAAAVAAAQAAGATPAQLQSLEDLNTAITSQTTALGAAVAANTAPAPAAPAAPTSGDTGAPAAA